MGIVRAGATAFMVAGLALGSTACSKSDSRGSAPTTTTPEEARTTPAKVAASLGSINVTASKFAAAVGQDKAEAQDLLDQIEPTWYKIEGTVKANDEDAYIAFEDAFAVLSKANDKGDAALAAEAAHDVATATAAYLQAYPG